ncbi:hypothetical protein HED51_05425 [Ochrobactrum grignonense]|nr:hypothetical protein [Brucella grignonensis]
MTTISRFRQFHTAALLGLTLAILPQSANMAFAEDILAIATPPQTPADINNFKLTEDLLARMEKSITSSRTCSFHRLLKKVRMRSLPWIPW